MKVMTVVGTRPEIIRMSQMIKKLDEFCNQILVHTGQSYDDNMSEVFFKQLDIRQPDERLFIGGETVGNQIGKLFAGIEQLMYHHQPDRFLILGDTNSALSAIIAKRMGAKVYHLEAGNRCHQDIPEEINRRVIDHVSDIHLPYTDNARRNLLEEGILSQNIYVVGNPIFEVLKVAGKLCATDKHHFNSDGFFLATAHRQENVDNPERLSSLLLSLNWLAVEYQREVIFSCHPRTRKQIEAHGFHTGDITIHEPFGFNEFITLEKLATCVLTDSGTVQEECCILGVPCVTLRDVTERPETVECGSNILSGVNPDNVLRCVKAALVNKNWCPPAEYLKENVSDTVINIVTGY